MVEVVIKIPAIEKLLDYTASGIGATAGPLLLPLRAQMEGKADRISARAYADTLPIIAQAQAEARQYLVAPDADIHGSAEITHENITQLLKFQGRKRLANIRSVVEHAAGELGDREVTNHEPDHDWTARFFDCVQDVSSEHMQRLWAKLLSGEVEGPGRTSLRTLETLRNMTQRDAEHFEEIAGYAIEGKFIFYDRSHSLHFGAMKYGHFLHLQDCGLVNAGPSLNWTLDWQGREGIVLSFQGGVLLIDNREGVQETLVIPAVLLTDTGQELIHIVQGKGNPAYLQDLSSFLNIRRCQLSRADDIVTLSDGSFDYINRTLIEPRPIQPGMPAL